MVPAMQEQYDDPEGRTTGPTRRDRAAKRTYRIPFIVAGAVVLLVVIGLVVWLVAGLADGGSKAGPATSAPARTAASSPRPSSPAATEGPDAGVILSAAAPTDWVEGDCLKNYKDFNTAADVVTCTTAHNAQLVKTQNDDSASYPGDDTLKAKAKATCAAVVLNSAANNYTLAGITPAYPTQSSWESTGDRRIFCIVSAPDGNVIKDDLRK